MTTTKHQIIELLTQLPPTAQAELFDFAEFLLHKHRKVEATASALDILAEPLVETSFRTADEIRDYLNEERAVACSHHTR